MTAKASAKPQVFPFNCTLKNQTYDFKGQVLDMNHNGFMCNIGKQVIKTSETLTARISFPFTKKTLEVPVIVYKVYDKFKGQHNTINPGDHIIEFVYKNPSPEFKNFLTQFMAHVQAYLV
jgi:hypothetical protein